MSEEITAKFKKWFDKSNKAIVLWHPSYCAYSEGHKEGQRSTLIRLSECLTYEEMLHIIKMELENLEN
jgi:hypothetical protein